MNPQSVIFEKAPAIGRYRHRNGDLCDVVRVAFDRATLEPRVYFLYLVEGGVRGSITWSLTVDQWHDQLQDGGDGVTERFVWVGPILDAARPAAQELN